MVIGLKLITGLKIVTGLKMITGQWSENGHQTLDMKMVTKRDTGHKNDHWMLILHNFRIFVELSLKASKSSQNKLKLFPIKSKYINNIKTLHKQELLINIHQINSNQNFKTQNLKCSNFHFFKEHGSFFNNLETNSQQPKHRKGYNFPYLSNPRNLL